MFGWYQKLNLRWKIRLPLLLLVIVVLYMGYYSTTTSRMLGANAITIAKVNLPEIELLIQADRVHRARHGLASMHAGAGWAAPAT